MLLIAVVDFALSKGLSLGLIKLPLHLCTVCSRAKWRCISCCSVDDAYLMLTLSAHDK
jgi:hypothetical protein